MLGDSSPSAPPTWASLARWIGVVVQASQSRNEKGRLDILFFNNFIKNSSLLYVLFLGWPHSSDLFLI